MSWRASTALETSAPPYWPMDQAAALRTSSELSSRALIRCSFERVSRIVESGQVGDLAVRQGAAIDAEVVDHGLRHGDAALLPVQVLPEAERHGTGLGPPAGLAIVVRVGVVRGARFEVGGEGAGGGNGQMSVELHVQAAVQAGFAFQGKVSGG